MTAMQPEELVGGEYVLTGEMTHDTMVEFVVEHFLRRTSWLTRAHHAMSIAVIAAIVAVAWTQGRGILYCLAAFFLALATLVLVVLPLHELLHAAGYRLVGARDIRWSYSWRMLAVWVVAHRFVAGTRAFLVVALAPFVVLNPLLVALAVAFPQYAVYVLFVLLLHLHGAAGDWALMNFVWLNRDRGFWTWDDATIGRSYFYGRAGDVPAR
jgi:hypothetical protein